MKNIKYFILAVMTILIAGCSYDDSELTEKINGFKERIAALQTDITSMNSQIQDLSSLTSGNVITSVTKDSNGHYVITYKDNKDQTQTVVIATEDQMINVPLLGVKLDTDSNLYYWTVTVDGTTSFLTDNGAKVPVSGYSPKISVDSDGYWTVDGVRLKDASGNPVEAKSGSTSIFKAISTTDSGDLSLTLGNGTTVTLPVQGVLNMTLSSTINSVVADATSPISITYSLSGTNSASALVGIAQADGISAVLDRATKTVKVTFPSDFTEGDLIMVAYDMEEHTVIRPVFFRKAAAKSINISSAADLVQFASDVNKSTGAENMKVYLTADIDMSSIAAWIPIGNGTFNGVTSDTHVSSYTGAAFKGTFDGQGHSIKNITLKSDLTGTGSVYGLFGILDGATVENLTMGAKNGDGSTFTVSANGVSDAGVIAGACLGSTIQNCVNWIPVVCNGNSTDNARFAVGGFVGFVYGGTDEGTMSTLSYLVNNGAITASMGACTKNGATSVQVGGIAGFSNAPTASTLFNVFSHCTNNGDMSSSTARTSGILASCNQHTSLSECINNGDQMNTCSLSGGGRLGNITCVMGTSSTMSNCVNNGDLVATNAATNLGGLVSLLNHAECTITGGGNYGAIIGDITTYRGTLVANFSKFASVSGVTAGGKIGAYNGGSYQMIELTQENYMSYIGKYSSLTYITNIIFNGAAAPVTKGISTAAELVEFADSVNSGKTYTQWMSADSTVKLLSDIDMSGVSSWTPVGNGTFNGVTSSTHVSSYTGAAFKGVFDGQGHSIRNITLKADLTGTGSVYGLFGILDGATVKNLTMGAKSGDASVFTVSANGISDAGVIAGVCFGATIKDCINWIPVTCNGNATDNMRFAVGGFAGFVYGGTTESTMSTLSGLVNNGAITAQMGACTKNGATSVQVGGIAGFADAASETTFFNVVSGCTNNGNMTSSTARTSGILAACNQSTSLTLCTNNGDQMNTCSLSGGGRIGNITCIMGTNCKMTDCVNYGDVVATNAATNIAGLVSLLNHSACTISGGANYGAIIGDITTFRGTLVANFSKFASVKGVTAGGKIGAYNGGTYQMVELTSSNYMSYIGKYSDDGALLITDIKFDNTTNQ
jgi:hypothetical protein